MERSEYPAMLPQLQPSQAVDILNDRVRQVSRLNTSIADWLQERRKLEEQYSSGLRRLARRQIDDVDLGIFSVPWSTLLEAANTSADSHSSLASKIEIDVEQPLRNFASTNREMQAMSTIQGNLASMARDVDKAQQKAEKLQGKGDRAEAGRVANASSEVENAQSQWDTQAPYVFENLQAVDETRINTLRDVLIQMQTHEVDMVAKSQSTAEHCLNVLLSLQTEDEIKTFALRAVQGQALAGRSHPRASVAAPSRSATGFSAAAPSMSQHDDASQRSGSVQEDKKKSRFSALKRIGTVAGGRKRESKMPTGTLPSTSESPERKSKSPFNSFGGRFGKSKGMTELEPPAETPPRDRPRSPLRMGSEVMEAPRDGPSSPSPSQRPSVVAPQTNGTSSAFDGAPQLPLNIPNGSHQGDLADLEPPKPSQPIAPTVAEPQRDAEGYSVRPTNLDPISQAQADAASIGGSSQPAYNVNIRDAPIQDEGGDSAALANMANTLQPPPIVASKVGTVRGRRTRPVSTIGPSQEQPQSNAFTPSNTLSPTPASPMGQTASSSAFPASSPIQAPVFEQPRESFTAPIEVPRSQPPVLSDIPSPGSNVTSPAVAGGAAVAGGVAASGSFSPFASTMSQHSPFRPDSRSAVADHSGDTGSIRSGRSLNSTTSQAIKHPDLTETGLNSSIIETVSARFENGQLVTSSLLGEIALAYNPADFSSPFGNEVIRLENFGALEKVAPNPAFIHQSPDKEGEYTVILANIAKTQVAFKYQIRSDDAKSQTPLLIKPAFKIEPNQASIIVSYSLNPSFDLQGRTNITLSNVAIGLTLEGAKATGCLSKPVGTFSRERNLIYWQLGDITLTADAAPEKLLARFATESEASSGNVEARWEITGEHAHGLGSGLTVSTPAQAEGADPFADEAAGAAATSWKAVNGVRKLVSGAYASK